MSYQTDIIPAYVVSDLLLISIGSFTAVTLTLFVVLIGHKIRTERRERHLQELREVYGRQVARKLAGQGGKVTNPTTELEFEAVTDVIIDSMFTCDESGASLLRQQARELGLDVHHHDLASASNWTKRYRAIERLGFLKFPEQQSLYQKVLTEEKELHVIAKTVWALSFIADEKDIATINRYLKEPYLNSSKLNEHIYTNIIRAFIGREEAEKLLTQLDAIIVDPGIPLLLKRDIIEACGKEKFHAAEEKIIGYFRTFHENPEIRISCIRALENLGYAAALPVVIAGMEDEDWRVRAVAAKNASICGEAVIDHLERLLHDSSYHVRINAAQSLGDLGEKGIEALTRGTGSTDRFVRDVTHYVLEGKLHVV